MLKAIAIVVALLIAAVLALAVSKPDTFRVERKAVIKAPPEKVFGLVSDFKQWPAWSPWENRDPAMKRTFGAATSGKGASYAWEGNKDVGQGRMEIVDATPPSKLAIDLQFIKPWEARNKVDFVLAPVADGTQLTWSMQGTNNFISKLMQVFMDMDKMVGPDFEAGLAKLKMVAEK